MKRNEASRRAVLHLTLHVLNNNYIASDLADTVPLRGLLDVVEVIRDALWERFGLG